MPDTWWEGREILERADINPADPNPADPNPADPNPAGIDPAGIDSRKAFGEAFTALRQRADLTVRALATRAKVPVATTDGWVRGKHLPGPAQSQQFADLLAVCGVTEPEVVARWHEALRRVRAASDGRTVDGVRDFGGAAPYRGLKPFEPQDAGLFFGRTEFVAEVITRLAALRDDAVPGNGAVARDGAALRDGGPSGLRMLFLVGASGSGKSSVLRAGVIPAVLGGALATGEDREWSVAVMVPGRDPVGALQQALDGAAPPRLLVIDQFEELYTLAGEGEAARFVAALTGVGPRTLIAAGLRADFFPGVASDPLLIPSLQHWQMVVPPLCETELRAVVVGPAQAWGVAVDDNLVDIVLAEALPGVGGTPHHNALPLLSHALLSAWEHRKRGHLTVADYRAAGGLAGAVQQSAEAAYAELAVPERELARRMFLRLVNVDEDFVTTKRRIAHSELPTTHDPTVQAPAHQDRTGPGPATHDPAVHGRAVHGQAAHGQAVHEPDAHGQAAHEPDAHGQAAHGQAGAGIDAVLERFVARRLITVDERHIEVSHDALLSVWPRLAEWIAADHAGLLVHRRLTNAANAWQATGRDDQALMRGTFLAGAEEWARDPDHLAAMNQRERDLLAASAESRRLEARAARHRIGVLRRLVTALAVLLLVAFVSAGWAFHLSDVAAAQRHDADRARDEALSRQVAIESVRATDSDPALAQQLALVAYRISPTVDARSALLDAAAPGIIHRLVGASGPTVIRLDPAGRVLAVSDASRGDVVLYRYSGSRPGRRLGVVPAAEPGKQVFAVAFSPDGATLAAGGTDGQVRLFDVGDPSRPVRLATAPGAFGAAVEALAFSPDGGRLVAAGSQPALRMWSGPWSRPDAVPPPSVPAAETEQSVVFSPDGRTMVAAGSAGLARIWTAGAAPVALRIGSAPVNAVAFAPDGRTFAAGLRDGTAVVVTGHQGLGGGRRHPQRVVTRLATGFTSWVNAVAYSPDGTLLAVGGSNGAIDVFDTRTATPAQTIANSSQVTALTYARDSRVLLAAAADGTVRGFPAQRRAVAAAGGPIFALGYDRTGRQLAVASSGDAGAASLWSAAAGPPGELWSPSRSLAVRNPAGFGPSDGTVAFSADGRLVATGNHDGQVSITRTGNPPSEPPPADPLSKPSPANPAAESSPAEPAAGPVTGNRPSTPALGDPPAESSAGSGAAGSVVLGAGSQIIEGVAFSPDGRTLAASSDDGLVRLWDVSDPAAPRPLKSLSSDGEAASIAFSPDGRMLAAASVDHQVHLWAVADPGAARALPSLTGFGNYAWSVAFAPDSRTLAAGGADDTVRLWDLSDPARPRSLGAPLTGPTHYVYSLGFSPDGSSLAAAAGDGSVWTWRLGGRRGPQVFTALHRADPGGHTYAIAYSPDGLVLAGAGSAGEVVFWDTDPDKVVSAICAAGGDGLTRAEWGQYVPGLGFRSICP